MITVIIKVIEEINNVLEKKRDVKVKRTPGCYQAISTFICLYVQHLSLYLKVCNSIKSVIFYKEIRF